MSLEEPSYFAIVRGTAQIRNLMVLKLGVKCANRLTDEVFLRVRKADPTRVLQ